MTRAVCGLGEKKNHLLLLSGSVMSDSLWPRGPQHVSLPCPSPSPGACSNSCPFSQWCRPAILTSAAWFSFCLQEACEGHDQSCLWLRARGGVCVSSSHPSGHTVGWHVSAPASTVSPMLRQWKHKAWPRHLQPEVLCGQPCSLLPVAEGGGCPGTQGTTWTEACGREDWRNIHLCSDKALWLGVPFRWTHSYVNLS